MFRSASRPLLRIRHAPSARCVPPWSALRIQASTRPILRATRPYSTPPPPSFASTFGKRGWWQWAWFREDGTPRSKRKGALYAVLASAALIPIPVLMYALLLTEEHSFIAWSLVQCYRTDARYDKVNWEDFDTVVDYFHDVSGRGSPPCLLVTCDIITACHCAFGESPRDGPGSGGDGV